MHLKPNGHLVLVQPTELEPVSELHVVGDVSKHGEGVALACGPKVREFEPPAVVVYAKTAGTPISVEGNDMLLLAEREVLAIRLAPEEE